jgi:hypothetical protein
MSRPVFRYALATTALALLAACSKPLPPERAAYVGDWRGPSMSLQITQEGEVHYLRQNGNASTNIDAPLQEFVGNDFRVGVSKINTLFVVSKPPTEKDGVWIMTVDGVELTRKN